MLNIGTPELLVILLVALLVLGPTKLPEAARQVGRAMAELRRLSSGFQDELRNAMQEPTVERSPTPLATPAPPEPDDHEAMNATLAAARDEAVAAAEAAARGEDAPAPTARAPRRAPLRATATREGTAPSATGKATPAKKAARTKKGAPARKATAAKKATAPRKASRPAKKQR